MSTSIETILIPSGPSKEEDLRRLKKGLTYASTLENSRVLISGIGPDLNERLHWSYAKGGHGYIGGTIGLDVHPELWSTMIKLRQPMIFGVDSEATTTEENFTKSFPLGQEGYYTIFTRPLHIKKFKLIEENLRKKGKLSPRLKIDYRSSGYSKDPLTAFRDIIYDSISIVKQIYQNWKN